MYNITVPWEVVMSFSGDQLQWNLSAGAEVIVKTKKSGGGGNPTLEKQTQTSLHSTGVKKSV